MTRYLVYTSPARGHLYPIVPTLQELMRRDHEVIVKTLASEVDLVRNLGFAARPIDPAIERREMDDWRASKKPLAAQQRGLRTFLDRAPHEVPDLRQAMDEERPDALFVDINCWGAAAVAEAWGGPWAYFAPFLLFIPSRDAPPFGPGLPPLKGPVGKLRDGLVRWIGNHSVDRLLPDLNALRADLLGLPPVSHLTHLPLTAPLLIYYSAEPFEYPRSDWPESVRMVGPGVWDPPARKPAWLDESDEPLVLVTISTEFQNDARLVEVALEALKDEDVRIVATTAAVDPSRFESPANARVERFLPHEHILERAACVICHGGMGITQKALAKGVPVCAVPFGRDQLEVARRVEVAGAGSRLPASRLRPDRLRSAVREAMGKKDGAEHIAAAFASTGGPEAAAEALEKLANHPVSSEAGAVETTNPQERKSDGAAHQNRTRRRGQGAA